MPDETTCRCEAWGRHVLTRKCPVHGPGLGSKPPVLETPHQDVTDPRVERLREACDL